MEYFATEMMHKLLILRSTMGGGCKTVHDPCSPVKSAVVTCVSLTCGTSRSLEQQVPALGLESSSCNRQSTGTRLVATAEKKSPSDGQGRVAHRRGSRFYTTILRVVARLNTAFLRKSRRGCVRRKNVRGFR